MIKVRRLPLARGPGWVGRVQSFPTRGSRAEPWKQGWRQPVRGQDGLSGGLTGSVFFYLFIFFDYDYADLCSPGRLELIKKKKRANIQSTSRRGTGNTVRPTRTRTRWEGQCRSRDTAQAPSGAPLSGHSWASMNNSMKMKMKMKMSMNIQNMNRMWICVLV